MDREKIAQYVVEDHGKKLKAWLTEVRCSSLSATKPPPGKAEQGGAVR